MRHLRDVCNLIYKNLWIPKAKRVNSQRETEKIPPCRTEFNIDMVYLTRRNHHVLPMVFGTVPLGHIQTTRRLIVRAGYLNNGRVP